MYARCTIYMYKRKNYIRNYIIVQEIDRGSEGKRREESDCYMYIHVYLCLL